MAKKSTKTKGKKNKPYKQTRMTKTKVAATQKADVDPNAGGATRYTSTATRAEYFNFEDILNSHKHNQTGIVKRIAERMATKNPDKMMMREKITVNAALDLLCTNIENNRKPVRAQIDTYRQQLKEGKWEGENGETIKINNKGKLCDGQHRLWAQVLEKKEATTWIFLGVTEKGIATIDTGRSRTASDTLSIEGFTKNPQLLAAVVKGFIQFQKTATVSSFNTREKSTNVDVIEWVNTFKEHTEKIIEIGIRAVKDFSTEASFLKPSQWTLLYMLLWDRPGCKAKAEQFIVHLSSGSNIGPDNNAAIFYCRRNLTKLDRDYSHTASKIRLIYKFKLAIKAWNYWVKGDHVTEVMMNLTKDDRETNKIPTPNHK